MMPFSWRKESVGKKLPSKAFQTLTLSEFSGVFLLSRRAKWNMENVRLVETNRNLDKTLGRRFPQKWQLLWKTVYVKFIILKNCNW